MQRRYVKVGQRSHNFAVNKEATDARLSNHTNNAALIGLMESG